MKETKHGDIIVMSDDEPLANNSDNDSSRPRRTHEIQGEDHRRMAVDGLTLLWKAMQLTKGPSLLPGRPSHETYDLYDAMYRQMGIILLGDDYPTFEVRT